MSEPSVSPVFDRGGNISIQTAIAGANFVAFAAQVLAQLTIVNDTGATIEFQQDGAGVAIPIFDGTSFSIFGVTDASRIGVRRVDQAATQVIVKARWES